VADGYLCGAALDLVEHHLVEIVDALQFLKGAASCFSSPTGGDNAGADILSFRRTMLRRGPHAEAKRSGAAGGRVR
jgi:hypothetical protein